MRHAKLALWRTSLVRLAAVALVMASGAAGTAKGANAAKVENVVIVVIDGARHTEAFAPPPQGGRPARSNVPHLARDLGKLGVVFTDFRNEGATKTCPGHVAITTGRYENVANNGSELPSRPTLTQLWLAHSGAPAEKAWIVAGKDKLDILADSSAKGWKGKHVARTDCPRKGARRKDSETWEKLKAAIKQHHPRLVVVNFAETDREGHSGDWEGYLQAIRRADGYVWELWRLLQSDRFYAGRTALFVTGDHGRHDDEHGRFRSHGCSCEGCRRLFLVAVGPGIRRGVVVVGKGDERRELTDIAPTVGKLMGFAVPEAEGEVLSELFEEAPAPAPSPVRPPARVPRPAGR